MLRCLSSRRQSAKPEASFAPHARPEAGRTDVAHDSVDDALDELERVAAPAADVSLARVEIVGRLAGHRANRRLAWADVVAVAGTNARVVGQYLVFMAVA